jgi:hypothetical protein
MTNKICNADMKMLRLLDLAFRIVMIEDKKLMEELAKS